ncbi:MAG TPA: glucarate dehydratase [Lachnospiraceae bacterium]|nr:glucarate dehydratase [Lachnospiraceae bacterium]
MEGGELMKGTPVVTDMQVIPVAGYDSMLMTLSGAHAPWFTRNLVILKDSSGNTGIGEIHGGDYTCEALRSCVPLVVGQPIGKYRAILDTIHKNTKKAKEDDGEGIQTLDISKLKFVVKAEWAIECALLDLLGQYLDLPMCELLGDGKQRDKVETLGYLFYVSDKEKAAPDLPYIDESDSSDPWFAYRRKEILTHEAVVEEAMILHDKYGFKNFKLKGGVLEGAYEMDTVRALKKAFPEGRINIDPNGAWSLQEAIDLCRPMENILTYIEDPCGPEAGYSSREIMAEFKNAVKLPVATNMIATDWRQFYHSAALKSVDIVLADPHFWGFGGSIRIAQLLNDWGLTWGSHSNNHFDITLAAFAQVAAAAPGNPTALDTHWIWQDGQNLLKDTPQIRDGYLELPEKPGLGVTIDMEKVMEANALYNKLPSHDRNDATAMQYLIPNWVYDSKRPALVR